MNIFEEELIDFVEALNKHKVRFILVGGLAVNCYGYSRTTGDIDLWLEDSKNNREHLINALSEVGVEGANAFLTYPFVAGYSEILLNNGVYVDLMADLKLFKQKDFEECFAMSQYFTLSENISVKVLHINKLLEEKLKSTRPKDIDDAEQLQKLLNKKKTE